MNNKTKQLKEATFEFINKLEQINPKRDEVFVSLNCLKMKIIESLRDAMYEYHEYHELLSNDDAKNLVQFEIDLFKSFCKDFDNSLDFIAEENKKLSIKEN